MANRAKYPAQSYGVGREYMEMRIALGGAGAPTITWGKSYVATATHTGATNAVIVTLRDPFTAVVAHSVDVRDDAANGAYATIGTFTGEGTTSPISFKISTFNAAGTAANDSSLVVCVSLALLNSSVTQGN